MTVDHPLSRAKGKAGLFWAANHAGGPVKILDGDTPVLVFVNGYVFAYAVGMKEKYGDPMPYFHQEGVKTTIRASEFKSTETIINLCNANTAPVVVRKYSYLKVIQEIMGHADISTTMDIYNEATKDKKKESFAGLEGKIKIR